MKCGVYACVSAGGDLLTSSWLSGRGTGRCVIQVRGTVEVVVDRMWQRLCALVRVIVDRRVDWSTICVPFVFVSLLIAADGSHRCNAV